MKQQWWVGQAGLTTTTTDFFRLYLNSSSLRRCVPWTMCPPMCRPYPYRLQKLAELKGVEHAVLSMELVLYWCHFILKDLRVCMLYSKIITSILSQYFKTTEYPEAQWSPDSVVLGTNTLHEENPRGWQVSSLKDCWFFVILVQYVHYLYRVYIVPPQHQVTIKLPVEQYTNNLSTTLISSFVKGRLLLWLSSV
jgi:hypothetical protein